MSANDIVSIAGIIILTAMGIYFNQKFKQIGKDDDFSHKKI